MGIVTTLKNKALLIAFVVLTSLLIVTYMSGKSDREELKLTSEKLLEHVTLNKRLSDENLRLVKELKEKPPEYITLTKEVMKEVCNGVVKQTLINSLPSKKGNVNEEKVVDIDDRLPDDLIRLLK